MTFDSAELFKEPEIAISVCASEPSDIHSLTPRLLYQEIKRVADARYGYTLLPKKLQQLKILESVQNKFALLRDLCKATGIQINFTGGKQFVLDNDTVLMKQYISRLVQSRR